jgi:hypothetical protein
VSRPTYRNAAYAVLAAVPFIAVLVYFRCIDVYDRHFFDSGITLTYNSLRVVFIVYLFGMICVPGYAALSAIGGTRIVAELRPLERLAASFFCGAALWHGLLLLLGFLNFYVYPVAVALSVPAAALIPVCLGNAVRGLYRDARACLRHGSRVISRIIVLLGGATVSAALLLLILKGLFPAGGHDYFNHYHGYYEAVLRDHGIWPNEVWYQFYYSKGMGLFFLATLLTDPLAPSLVTYCFAIAAAMALFLVIARMSVAPNFWPWIAVIAYLALYAYTPGFGEYRLSGGWGDFEKPHEINAAFVIGFLWLSAGLRAAPGRQRRVWLFAAGACVFIVSIVELVTVLLLGLFTAMLTVIALARRRPEEAKAFFVLSVVAGCGVIAVLALNYFATGLASDQFAAEVWPWANVQTLSRWGALPYVVLLMQGLAKLKAQGLHPWSWQFLGFFQDLLRLDLVKPLLLKTWIFAPLVAGAALLRARHPHQIQDSAPLWLTALLLLTVTAAAVAAGTDQTISFYRYSSFCLPAVIALAGCGWLYVAAPIRLGWLNAGVRYGLPVILLVAGLSQFTINQARFLRLVIPEAAAFAAGSSSIADAYTHQQGWAGRQPWGGIFPGMVGAWRAAGPGTRIWSMHLWTYCMLPHCRAETFFSFVLSPRLLDLLEVSPEDARAILQGEGLNYFFFTTAMPVDDILPLIKPFAPDRIADYVGVKWTDGTSYLLTWFGPGATPLTQEWVAQYRNAVETAPGSPNGFSLPLMLSLREQLRGNPRWGRDLKLPAATN